MTEIKSFRKVIKHGSKHAPEVGRYILYVSLGCPFAMRAIMTRHLKGLQRCIDLCILDYHFTDQGLRFVTSDQVAVCNPDPVMNAKFLRELYLRACPSYQGLFTVPMIWDKKLATIVNNESEDIMRMFNSNMNDFADNPSLDLYPEPLWQRINELADQAMVKMMMMPKECGNAQTQEEYEHKAREIKQAFQELDAILSKTKYLCGYEITEADIKIFNYVIRHDLINWLLFRITNFKLAEFSNIMRWIKDVLDCSGLREWVNLEHIKGMTFSKKSLNPSGIIPLGNWFTLP